MAATTTEGTGPGDSNKRVAYLSSQLPKQEFTTTTTNDQDLITGIVEAVGGDCPKYVVSADNLDCPYQTIQDGYDAAVADGHNEENPAMVRVLVGNYSEDVVITQPGIHIVGDPGHDPYKMPFGTSAFTTHPRNPVVNTGKLTVDFDSASVIGPTQVQNIDWIVDGLCLEVLGSLYTNVVFRECQFGPGVFMGSNDLTCCELANTEAFTLIIFQHCIIANFGAESVPLVNTRQWTEFFHCLVNAGFIFDGICIRAYGGVAQSITLQHGITSGAIVAEDKSRYLTNNDQFLGGNLFPTTGGDLEGVFIHNATGEVASQSIFEDTTFGVGSGLRHLFTGSGSTTIEYGARVEIFDVSFANINKSVWKNPGASGSFAVAQLGDPWLWMMERMSYESPSPGDWAVSPPDNIRDAIDRMAAAIFAAHGAIP